MKLTDAEISAMAEDGVSMEKGIERAYRLELASRAPQEEIDWIIGQSVVEAADFLGIPVEEYEAKTHYLIASVKARFMWADAMIKEANK